MYLGEKGGRIIDYLYNRIVIALLSITDYRVRKSGGLLI